MGLMPTWEREFVGIESATAPRNVIGFHPCQGGYFRPVGRRPRVALIAAHYGADFSEHYLAPSLAERGYGFLGFNTRFRGAEASFLLEHALVDLGAGVNWLREVAGVEAVVLLGNSGGGSLMAAYQSQATQPTLSALPGLELPAAVNELAPADAFITLNAHPGRPEVLTAWMDPSVTDEGDPTSLDPSLSMYAPENAPPYSPEFVARYRAAQTARNGRITAWVKAELERLANAGHFERFFSVPRLWADLRMLDGTLDPSDREVGVCYAGDPKFANNSPFGIAGTTSLRTWLSMWSLEDSACRGELHFSKIEAPSLVLQTLADTGVFPSDARFIHEHLAAKDKRIELLPGDHFLTQADARTRVADTIVDWLREHRF